jgi:phage-related protein
MDGAEKPLAWIGNSKKDLMALPAEVRRFFGHALDFAQRGEQHGAAKILKGFGGGGVMELVENDVGGTYRAVYTVSSRKRCSCCIASKRRAKWNRHAQTRHGHYSRTTESG